MSIQRPRHSSPLLHGRMVHRLKPLFFVSHPCNTVHKSKMQHNYNARRVCDGALESHALDLSSQRRHFWRRRLARMQSPLRDFRDSLRWKYLAQFISGDEKNTYFDSMQENQGFHIVLSVSPSNEWGSCFFEKHVFRAS